MDTDIKGEPKEISHRVYRRFKELQRARLTALRKRHDSETIDKLDHVIRRDLGLDLREQALSRLWGEGQPQGRRYKALVTLRQAPPAVHARNAQRGMQWNAQDSRPRATPGKIDRAQVGLMRRGGLRALERLRPTLEGREGIKVKRALWLTRSLALEVDAATLVELAERGDVASVAHDKEMILIYLDGSRPLIRADQVENNLGITGRGIQAAILDTGVDFSHAALVGVMGGQFDFTGEGVGDMHGHGTHCAGVVASNDGNRRGIAPGVVLSDYKHLSSTGSGSASNGIAAIQQSVTDGIAVSSNSWGASHANGLWTCPDGTCVYCTAANAAVAAGQVFVVAAGNDNNDSCATYDTHIGCPGNASDVITVGGSTKSDGLYNNSSLGPTPDGRAKPDVIAPGVDIVSCRASTGSDMGGHAPVVDEIWCRATGTSMSTPHVSGTAALMLEKNPALTPAQIKSVLMSTAIDLGGTPDEQGSGRIDAFAAVSAV